MPKIGKPPSRDEDTGVDFVAVVFARIAEGERAVGLISDAPSVMTLADDRVAVLDHDPGAASTHSVSGPHARP